MSDLTKIELHDALIRGLSVDYRGKTVTVDIDLYSSQGERNRLPGAIEFKGVTSISLIGDLERLAQHASAGNVNYWFRAWRGAQHISISSTAASRLTQMSSTSAGFEIDNWPNQLSRDNTYAYVGGNPLSGIDPFGLCTPGTHPATPDEIKQILAAANAIQKLGLTHAKIQCNEFVDKAINDAFPGAVSPFVNTTNMLAGQGPFQPTTTPAVGDLAVLHKPGHVVFITGMNNGAVTQFQGSQTSSGPATVNLPDPYYWSDKFNLPGNVSYFQICLPD